METVIKKNHITNGIFLVALLLLTSVASARVYAPRVVSEHNADAYSMKTFAQYPVWSNLNGDQKAWAIFEYLTDYETGLYPMGTGAFEGSEMPYEYSLVRDPVKMINGYSIGYCDVFGPVMAGIWRDAGLGESRVVDIPWIDHVTTEIYYNDSWHYLDLDLRAAFLREDNSLASLEDSRTFPSLWDRPNGPRFFPLDNIVDMKSAYEQSDLRQRYGVAESGHTMDFVLRQGESFTRWWEPQGGRWLHHPNYENESFIGELLETQPRGPKSKHASFSRYTHGNGKFEYEPDLRIQSSDFIDGVYDSNNVELDQYGLTLSESGSGYAVFEVRTPYVIVPLVGDTATTADDVDASVINIDAVNASYSISLDNGITWTTVQANGAELDLTALVAGTYGYLFKIELNGQPGEAVLQSLKMTTWVQLAPASLPSLRVGSNKMQFKSNDHYDLPTRVMEIQPSTSNAADFYKHLVVEPTGYFPESITSRIHGPFVVAATAPPNTKIAWFSTGGSFESDQLSFAPFTQFTIDYAADLPFAFTNVYSASLPDDMEHWHSNGQVDVQLDDLADSVYVRYEGDPAVNNVRIFAHVVDDDERDSSAVTVTHRWIEDGVNKLYTTSSDLGNEYFIDVDSVPEHTSITMSVESQYDTDLTLSTISSPLAGQVLSGDQTTFLFNPGTAPFNEWRMTLGADPVTAQGLYDSGVMSVEAGSSEHTFGVMPTDGAPVYLRFWQRLAGEEWATFDTEYLTEYVAPPAVSITQPVSAQLEGATQSFTWQDSGAGVTEYWLSVGSSVAGHQYYNSGNLQSATSVVVSGLPNDGASTVYVRLWYREGSGSAWQFIDETYVAGTNGPLQPEITSAPGPFTNANGIETLSWVPNGSGAQEYWLYAGNVQGGRQYFDSGNIDSSLTETISGLPLDGGTIWIRLWYRGLSGSQWQSIDIEYTAANYSPTIDSSSGNGVLTFPDDTFSWSDPGGDVIQWWLYLGSSIGAKDYEDSGDLGAAISYTTVNSGLPATGGSVYVRLWFRTENSVWKFQDTEFTSASAP